MGNIFSIQLSCETIISRCLDCVAGQAAFICKLEDNLDALKTEVEKLKARSEDVMTRVRVAEEQQQLKPLAEVEHWRSRTETMIKEADLLIEESHQQNNKLFMGGCCSKHPRSSHKFGKQIAKKLQEVQDQWRDGDFDTVANTAPLPSVTIRPNEPTVGLDSTFDKAWCSLQEKHVGIIGLYGLGGVGKTTLLNQINNKFLDTPNDFVYVIWVVVSQDLQMEKLQEEIGKRIGFSNEGWKQKRLDEKAADIFSLLCKKKFALLLDDIWEWIDLTKVGVPLPTQVNGSKIIFTTRLIDVCFEMRAHEIKVECLQQPEALKLFEEKVGEKTLNSHPEIRELALKLRVLDLSHNRELVELPVGITKLASLEHLNLSFTGIREFPVELKALEKLKYLNLEWTWDLKMIPRQLISSFSKLQVLKMQGCGCEWSVEEIEHIKDLEVLTITFHSASMLQRALGSYKFKSCNVEDVRLLGFEGSRVLNIFGLANLQYLQSFDLCLCEDVEEVKMQCAGTKDCDLWEGDMVGKCKMGG